MRETWRIRLLETIDSNHTHICISAIQGDLLRLSEICTVTLFLWLESLLAILSHYRRGSPGLSFQSNLNQCSDDTAFVAHFSICWHCTHWRESADAGAESELLQKCYVLVWRHGYHDSRISPKFKSSKNLHTSKHLKKSNFSY